MSKKTIKINDLLNLIPKSLREINQADDLYMDYLGWKVIGSQQLERLEEVGVIKIEDSSNEEPSDYWDKNSLIDFDKYPYNRCSVYRYKGGNSYYLVYIEFGGHVPERRARLLQRSLIKPDERLLNGIW